MSFDATSLANSQPLRRILALALVAAVAAVLVAGIVLPTVERYTALESGIAENEGALQRFQQVAARLPRLEAERAGLKVALAAQDGFLKATSDPLIAAEMQGRIKSVVDRAGGQLKSTQIVPARDENGFRRVAARVEVVGAADALERIWYEMESGLPFLFIDNFDIAARQTPRKDRTQPPLITLDVRFEITAYARGAAP
ncbi:MAG TPA: type II secretion system protein GspM [Stellaceae bacterium]|nr:type II secretion system protein GspM [Stellaceae bacterium]